MAKRFHINPETGDPGKCRAKHSCPFGDLEREHYGSADEARAAYEKQMEREAAREAEAEESRRRHDEWLQRPDVVERHQRADALIQSAVNAIPVEKFSEWSETSPNSFTWKLASIRKQLDAGEIDEDSYYSLIEQTAAGEYSGLRRNISLNVQKLVEVRNQARMQEEYRAALAAYGVGETKTPAEFFSDDYGRKMNPSSYYSEETYVEALDKFKQDLDFVEPLTESYYVRYNMTKEGETLPS